MIGALITTEYGEGPVWQGLAARVLVAWLVMSIPVFLPILGPLFQLVAPGVLVAICYGLNPSWAGLVIFFPTVISGILFAKIGQAPLMVLVLQGSGIAWLLVWARWRSWPGPHTLIAGLVYLMAFYTALLLVASPEDPGKAYKLVVATVLSDMDRSFEMWQKAAGPGTDFDRLSIWFLELKQTVARLIPGLIAIMGITTVFTNILTARWLLGRRWSAKAFDPEFSMWRLPEHLVIGVIVSGAAAIFGKEVIETVGQNLLTVFGGLYGLQGFSVLSFGFKQFNVPGPIRFLIYILISIQWYGLLSIILFGLFDTWFDFRSRISKRSVRKE